MNEQIPTKAPLDMLISSGYGYAGLRKDGVEVYKETYGEGHWDVWSVEDVENIAKDDPEHDWRIIIVAPTHNEVYQRQGENNWALIEHGDGLLGQIKEKENMTNE